MNTDLKHSDITEKIIGASFDVHSFLGNGFQEVIYQRALAYEFTQANLDFNVKSISTFSTKIYLNL